MALSKLTPSQAATTIKTCIRMNRPLMLWSSPGVGKSDTVKQIAQDLDAQVVDIRLSMWDSVDFRGIPSTANGTTTWNPPAILPFVDNPKFDPQKLVLLFLDEAMQAMPSVQSVAFQLILDRAVGEHKLMDNVRIIMASNRQQDRGGANRMATPLANRLTHIELVSDLDSWCTWAFSHNKNPLVVAFLRLKPDLLDLFEQTVNPTLPANVTRKVNVGDLAFPTPRSWAVVADILEQNLPTHERLPLITGTIGESPATELEAFLRTWERMPNIDGILMNPASAPVPTEPDILHSVAAALVSRANKGNFPSIYEYVTRLPDEFAMLILKDATGKKAELMTTKTFSQAAVKYAAVWQD
jgi:hypothetical protein